MLVLISDSVLCNTLLTLHTIFITLCNTVRPSQVALVVKTEKAMAPHSSTLAWRIPWTEEPGRLQSMGSRRVGHDWMTSLSLFTFRHWKRKWILAWRIPGTGKPAGLLSMASHIIGHDWLDLAAAAAAAVKNQPAYAGDSRDASSIPGLVRTPGGGNGKPSSILA